MKNEDIAASSQRLVALRGFEPRLASVPVSGTECEQAQAIPESETRESKRCLNPCQHHYVCAPANGPQSEGVCRKCGATRLFSNSEAGLKDISADKRKRGGAATNAQRAEFYGDIKAAPGVWWA